MVLATGQGVDGVVALTIGMATYNDFNGVYFTLQALRLYQDLPDTELLVVDNYGCPNTKALVEGWIHGARYLLATEVRGTAAPRDLVFREARGEAVLCCDSHVLFAPGVIGRLKEYYREHPDCPDLLQGPLVYDDLQSISTHFEPVWRAEMWGTWATDPRGQDPEGEPFEIPMQGLGAFSCRKGAWPGFNPMFRGFGGEEGYIHEKFRRAGGRCLCLPWLRWTHRFSRSAGIEYPLTVEEKLRNYLIGHAELGLDPTPVLSHFSEILPEDHVVAVAAEVLEGPPQAPEPSAATSPEVNAGAAGGDNMRIVYIILAYRNVSGHRIGTHPNQLARLVSRLDAPSVSFFIHIDANTDDATYAEMVDGMIGRHNVCFLPRHQVTWGGWGTVAATLEGLEQVIRAKVSPDYVILLTGADYPLRTPGDIEAFLAEHRGTSFIDVRQLPDYTWNWHGTMDRFHGQSLPSGMKPFGGEGRWALSCDCAAYVKGVADGGLSRVFEGVGIPDEHFVHTVVANSPFRDRLSSLARVDAPAVKGVHYVDWDRGSPKVLGVEDFERLIASRALFARKFDIAEDSAILDMIDAHSSKPNLIHHVMPQAPEPSAATLPELNTGAAGGDAAAPAALSEGADQVLQSPLLQRLPSPLRALSLIAFGPARIGRMARGVGRFAHGAPNPVEEFKAAPTAMVDHPQRLPNPPQRLKDLTATRPPTMTSPSDRRVPTAIGDRASRRAIVCFVEDDRHLIQQVLALRHSWLYARSPDTDLVVMGPADVLANLPDDLVKIAQQPAADDPVWHGYRYANLIACLNGAGAERLDSYTHILRTDVDAFITPAWNDFHPTNFLVGNGGYSNDDEIRQRLRDIAARYGLVHRGLTNVGSTWYGPTEAVRRAGAFAEML